MKCYTGYITPKGRTEFVEFCRRELRDGLDAKHYAKVAINEAEPFCDGPDFDVTIEIPARDCKRGHVVSYTFTSGEINWGGEENKDA